jgi:3-phytase
MLLLLLVLAACGGETIVPDPTPHPEPMATLVVQGGTGGGNYAPGTVVAIAAAPPAAGMAFDAWTGDVAAVAVPASAQTSVTVPTAGAMVTATYAAKPVDPPGPPDPGGPVTASVETDPVPGSGDAADDLSIWIHPTDAAKSTIIGTDKAAGYLLVYDLDGKEIHRLDTGRVNNVDIRYGFPFDGGNIDLVAASDRTDDTIAVFRVDPATRDLVPLSAIDTGIVVYGFCLYKSAVTGDFHAFITSKDGEIEQWRLSDDGAGGVSGTLVRELDLGDTVEGCVADDEHGVLYLGEESEGIWRYSAEPGTTDRVLVDGTGSSGELVADVEGLTIYRASDGTGYLIASSQGADEYTVYERTSTNAYVFSFQIVGGVVDGTGNTDGIDVTSANLGAAFPYGFFAVQDGSNSGGQNFKLVPWERVAAAPSPALTMDPTTGR